MCGSVVIGTTISAHCTPLAAHRPPPSCDRGSPMMALRSTPAELMTTSCGRGAE
jgi:hypothetical protein